MFEDFGEAKEQSSSSKAAGTIGLWGLHVCKGLFVAYSATHGVMASLGYAAHNPLAMAAQIAGIIVIELTLVAVYLAFLNHRIGGGGQTIAAIITYAAGFVLASMGIVADSQINAGMPITGWLHTYLLWGLPIAPVIMVLGGLAIHYTDPQSNQMRKAHEQKEELAQLQRDIQIAQARGKVQTARAALSLQQQAQRAVSEQLDQAYREMGVQNAIRERARETLPALLANIGVTLPTTGNLLSPHESPSPVADSTYPADTVQPTQPFRATPSPIASANGYSHPVAAR